MINNVIKADFLVILPKAIHPIITSFLPPYDRFALEKTSRTVNKAYFGLQYLGIQLTPEELKEITQATRMGSSSHARTIRVLICNKLENCIRILQPQSIDPPGSEIISDSSSTTSSTSLIPSHQPLLANGATSFYYEIMRCKRVMGYFKRLECLAWRQLQTVCKEVPDPGKECNVRVLMNFNGHIDLFLIIGQMMERPLSFSQPSFFDKKYCGRVIPEDHELTSADDYINYVSRVREIVRDLKEIGVRPHQNNRIFYNMGGLLKTAIMHTYPEFYNHPESEITKMQRVLLQQKMKNKNDADFKNGYRLCDDPKPSQEGSEK